MSKSNQTTSRFTCSSQVKPLDTTNPTMGDDYLFAASATDCTGLTPTVAHNETEADNYDEIVHYLPPIPPDPVTGAPEDPMLAAEGIHAEVNTLDKNTLNKRGIEGNHIL